MGGEAVREEPRRRKSYQFKYGDGERVKNTEDREKAVDLGTPEARERALANVWFETAWMPVPLSDFEKVKPKTFNRNNDLLVVVTEAGNKFIAPYTLIAERILESQDYARDESIGVPYSNDLPEEGTLEDGWLSALRFIQNGLNLHRKRTRQY